MRLFLIIATTLAVARATFADDLTRRLEPLAGSRNRIVATVFDNYRSGRPRRVVAAFGDSEEATLLLVLFPDSARGRPRVLARETLDGRPGDVSLERVIDAKDVIVSLPVRHGTRSVVDRVISDHLVRIAEEYGEAIDLDGDGVREIIALSYAGRDQCGVSSFVYVGRWNGKRYVDDRRRYLTVLSNGKGKDGDELLLSASKRYVVRIFGPGRVTLDERDVVPGKPFRTEEDCHTIALHHGSARTRAFVEEVD
jgi:hypothetical protein